MAGLHHDAFLSFFEREDITILSFNDDEMMRNDVRDSLKRFQIDGVQCNCADLSALLHDGHQLVHQHIAVVNDRFLRVSLVVILVKLQIRTPMPAFQGASAGAIA